jgi:type VI protein secretion system component Hcp
MTDDSFRFNDDPQEGHRSWTPIRLMKRIDQTTPSGEETHFFTVTLEDATVSGDEAKGGGDVAIETITLAHEGLDFG